jgi:hypothetical protein
MNKEERIHSNETVAADRVAAGGHEESDVRVSPIVTFLICLTVSSVLVCIMIAKLFDYFESRAAKANSKTSPLAGERHVIPSEPRLQLAPIEPNQAAPNLQRDHPLEEWKRVKSSDETRLDSYGWVDQNAGVVRIPIEQAKKLILQRGLPFRAQSAGLGAPASGHASSVIRSGPRNQK